MFKPQKIIYGAEAREKLKAGVDKIADAVTTTLGPKGRNVALRQDYGVPHVVHDGVTVAKHIYLKDPFEDMGAQIVKQASAKTNDRAGDGTTTSILLAQQFIEYGLREIEDGKNAMVLRRELEEDVNNLIRELEKLAQEVTSTDKIRQVATISAQDEQIGSLIAKALGKVGREGVITVDMTMGYDLELEYTEGMQFDRGYISPYFMTDPDKQAAILEDVFVLVTDHRINNPRSLIPVLELISQDNRPVLVIAENVDGAALAAFIQNKLNGKLKSVCVKAPSFGANKREKLKDIAALTGANFIDKSAGKDLSTVTLNDLGQADKVEVTSHSTTIIGGAGSGEAIEERVRGIKANLKEEVSEHEKDRLEERLGALSGGIAVIKVGAPTETEMKEKMLRVEDAVNATKAAVRSGILPGGGTALLSLIKVAKSDVVRNALRVPFRKVLANAGAQEDFIADLEETLSEESSHFGRGFDVMAMEEADLFEAGVIDPAEVETESLKNALSAAIMVLTTDCLVVPEEEE